MKWAAGIAGFLLLLLAAAHLRTRYVLCDLYDPARLLGRSAAEVEAALGPPFHIEPGVAPGDATWQYQQSMDPEALVTFTAGRATGVEFFYWDCPPLQARRVSDRRVLVAPQPNKPLQLTGYSQPRLNAVALGMEPRCLCGTYRQAGS